MNACRCVVMCVCCVSVCTHWSMFLQLCFCSVSICSKAIHQSVNSTAHWITFSLPLHSYPSLLSHTSLSLSPSPSLSYFIPVTYSKCHFRYYRNVFHLLHEDHARALCMLFRNEEWNSSFMLQSVIIVVIFFFLVFQKLIFCFCTPKAFY